MSPINDGKPNVFLTWENLAFSMPMIAVCAVYAFFHYTPLPIALAILTVLLIGYQIRMQMAKQRNKRLEQMDDNGIQELLQQEEEEKLSSEQQNKQSKKKWAVQARLAKEKKKKAAGGDDEDADDMDDDAADLSAFAKKKKK
mmetsp:Transcript_7492/g.9760  ORF Transcript_7492/g.9760 Transcript_7492/m.9760 type:complete len:142 (+) Transcript_7492:179-604(+)|eukprot:CAMPEP_0198152762 /NCGR_PEP_ID=MMETSP1443-20131203/61229_1 /TAXON_ID=186043 /ORGANISM="Entomoneis sp., Strain CCMP2396" /LENGTH=141 /DNA_ID=CAMNT_0043818883 /DNA_START=159 /DNA_END=584 /DNA_ORIENTATION=+